MSKTYRCRVNRDITVAVDRHEQVDYRLRLNDILSRGETDEILREVLEQLGGEERDDGTVTLPVGDSVQLEVNPSERSATARSSERGSVEIAVDRTEQVLRMDDDEDAAQREADRAVEASIRDQVDRQTRDEVRRRLGQASQRVVAILREIRDRADKEALLRKARGLGTIQSVVEDADEATGARRITIELRLPD